MTKINLRITGKRHAHLQTSAKTRAKFKKDPAKTVGERAALTRLDTFCDAQPDSCMGGGGGIICLPTLTRGDIINVWTYGNSYLSYYVGDCPKYLYVSGWDGRHDININVST